MATQRDPADIARFVEEAGITLEHSGFPRIAGKVLGLLLITERPRLSADEIASALKASRGSVSTMTRLLARAGLVERVGIPGDRRTYYRALPGTFPTLMRASLEQLREFRRVVEEGLRLVSPRQREPHARLQEMHRFFHFFEREFPGLLARWEAQWNQTPRGR